MPFDGSGGFLRTQNWQADAAAGIKIVADRHDNEDDNFAAGLSSVVTKDGQTSLTAHIPFNGFRATGLGNPVDPQDAATKNYADSIRNFPTAIFLTGGDEGTPPASKAFIGFTVADIGFGARKGDPAANPVTFDRFVWNDKADLTGVDMLDLYFAFGTNLRSRSGAVPNEDSFNFWQGTQGKGPVLALRGATHPTSPGGYEFHTQNSASTLFLAATLDRDGNFTTAAAITAISTIGAKAAPTGNCHVFWYKNDNSEAALAYYNTTDGTLNFRVGGSGINSLFFAPGGPVRSGTGFGCKAGQVGAQGGSIFNFDWVGALAVWVDLTNLGNMTISSDYRIKKDVADLPSTWEQVKQLRPISYTQADYGDLFQADDIPRWGFIAHELQETLLETASTGHKDEENLIQSPNPMPVIAALTKALQEAMGRIEMLEGGTA